MIHPVSRRFSLFSAALVTGGLIAAMSSASTTAAPAPGKDASPEPQKLWAYVGTYTKGESKGIYLLELDLKSGRMSQPRLAGEAVNPSFVAIHPDHQHLYAVNEVEDFAAMKSGGVASFSIDPKSGKLTLLDQQPSKGAGPCYVVVDKAGKNALVANYSGGSVAVLPIAADGKLQPASAFIQHQGKGSNPKRQEGPHAHSINLDAANRYAFAADLGLDKIFVYKFDPAKGTLTPNDPPATNIDPGSGPRHFAFHPSGKYAYLINEMACTVTALFYDPKTGKLTPFQTIATVPEVKEGYSTAEIQVHPSGRFLYGSNRGHHSIAMFRIDPATGRLTSLGNESTQGQTPRNFGIDPTGRYLLACNQDSGTIVAFRINPETGDLAPTGQTVKVPNPVCVKFMPAP